MGLWVYVLSGLLTERHSGLGLQLVLWCGKHRHMASGVGTVGDYTPPTINFNHPRLLLYKFLPVIHHESHINGVFWKSGGFIHINDNLESVEYTYIYMLFLLESPGST